MRQLESILSRVDWTAVAVLVAILIVASVPSVERVTAALR
jgi:hypothetical protein